MSHYLDESRQARLHVYEQAEYIADQAQPAAARRLLERYLDACEMLTHWPEVGHKFQTADPRLQHIRIMNIPGYQSLIYYRYQKPVIQIIAVLHGSIDPSAVETWLRSAP